MALYEFRCRTCEDVFEVRRPMSDAAAPAVCPDGHTDTVKLLSMFARTGAVGGAAPVPAGGGGCCGGGCGCAR
jgi:putative FmdB family regulatory protein